MFILELHYFHCSDGVQLINILTQFCISIVMVKERQSVKYYSFGNGGLYILELRLCPPQGSSQRAVINDDT